MTKTRGGARPPRVSGEELLAKTIVLEVRATRFGNHRKVQDDVVKDEAVADKRRLRVSKTLLESEELNEIGRIIGNASSYANERELPTTVLRGGMHLWPLAAMEEADEALYAMEADFNRAVDGFVKAAPGLVKVAAKDLGPQFRASDYPSSPAEWRALFHLEHGWVTFTVPDSLEGVSRAIHRREVEKQKAKLTSAVGEIEQALTESFLKLIEDAAGKLAPERDGTRRALGDGAIKRMEEFFDRFRSWNVVNAGDLEKLVDRARDVMKGVDAKTLKRNGLARERVQETFAGIQKTLSTMVHRRSRLLAVDD